MKPRLSIFSRSALWAISGCVASRRALIPLAWLLLGAAAQAATYALGSSSLVEGPGAGVGSIVLAVTPATGAWTAAANSSWLHVTAGSTSGAGSRNVLFSFDANPGATRTGTFTIGGQPLTITQAGAGYVSVSLVTPVVSSGLTYPQGLALDAAGNIYIADTGSEAIREWMPATQTLVPLVTTGLINPYGVTVNAAGSAVYIANSSDNEIQKLALPAETLTTPIATGLTFPTGLALDAAGNLYIADTSDGMIKEWPASTGMLTTLVPSGLKYPDGVAVDAAGNVYIADALNSAVKEYSPATSAVTTLVSSGVNVPTNVAVDGSGNVYIADQSDNAIKEWVAASGMLVTLDSSGLYYPQGIAVDSLGNLYFSDTDNDAVKEIPMAFVNPTPRTETAAAGSDALPVVLPTITSLSGPFAPASDQSWLTLGAISGGSVSFSFTANSAHGSRTAHVTLLGQSVAVTQEPPPFFLASASLVEGNGPGTDSVILTATPPTGSWTAAANDSWLHVTPGSAGGTGSANVFFAFDANPGATRTGTLTIAGQTLTITQAGSSYLAAADLAPLVATGLLYPQGVAVDSLGNVYIADTLNNAIKEWSPATNTVATLISPVYNVYGLAVDSLGNLYWAAAGNNAILEWSPATQSITTLVTGLNSPRGVAVDGSGNVYIADTSNNAIEEWSASTQTLTTLVSTGLSYPGGVAVDASGNVYIADTDHSAIKLWSAATQAVTQLFSCSYPNAVAVDGSGNVYNAGPGGIAEWSPITATASSLVVAGVINATGVAVDGLGNVYFSDSGNYSVNELARAFVDRTPRSEAAGAGSDSLPMVLPATENLLAPFAPTSNQSWLTLGASSGGVVSFSVSANNSGPRYGEISLLDQSIPVLQAPGPFVLSASSLTVGSAAGGDSVVLTVTPPTGAWTAVANDGWLHVTPGSAGGVGSTNILLSFDPNPGATRSGTITIGGQTLTVTQAGSTYVAVTAVTALVSSGLSFPGGVAVDGSGNVYIADTNHSSIKEWTPATNTVATLFSNGLSYPGGVAVDGFGDIFIADTYDNVLTEEFPPVNNGNTPGSVTATGVSGLGFSHPEGVAVDAFGNAYVADTGNSAIKEDVVGTGTTTLVSTGLSAPYGVAVDSSGNVYIADTDNSAIKVWTPSTQTVATLVSTGLLYPQGVAVDGSGDVYIADTSSSAIMVWSPATQSVTPLVSSGLSFPSGLAVDGARNLYIADYGNAAIKELPHAFVDPTPREEPAAAGSDALPAVLPLTANLLPPFTPTSDESWLTIGGISSGIVSFNFTANPGPLRAAHLGLLGQSIAISQAAHSPPVAVNDAAYASTAAPITINVLANDLAFGYTVKVAKLTQPARGRVKLNPDHTITYTPNASFAAFAGTDSFTYTISDGLGDTSTATVTIRNPFYPIKGAYDGLVLYSGGTLSGTANGYLTLALTSSGSFTGSLKLAGFGYAFSGAFAPATGLASVTIKRAGQTPITLALSLDEATGSNLAVAISADGNNFTVNPGAREPYTNTSPAPSFGAYTAMLPPPTSTSSPNLPGGSGWATMAVSKSGTVTIAGHLGDGSPFSVGSLVHHGANDTFAFYAPLYVGVSKPNAPGSIVGTITFEALGGSDCDGSLAWVKPAQTAGAFYDSGFTASVNFLAAVYAGKTSAQVLTFTNKTAGAGTLELSLGSPSTPLSIPLTVSSRNVVTVNHPNTYQLTLGINATAGTFLGTVNTGAGAPTSAINGVIYQKTNVGAGFFLAPSATGAVTLTPH